MPNSTKLEAPQNDQPVEQEQEQPVKKFTFKGKEMRLNKKSKAMPALGTYLEMPLEEA